MTRCFTALMMSGNKIYQTLPPLLSHAPPLSLAEGNYPVPPSIYLSNFPSFHPSCVYILVWFSIHLLFSSRETCNEIKQGSEPIKIQVAFTHFGYCRGLSVMLTLHPNFTHCGPVDRLFLAKAIVSFLKL